MRYLITISMILASFLLKAQNELINVDVGDEVPEIVLYDIYDRADRSMNVNKLSNEKLIIIDFWATWCGACLAAMPKLDSIVEQYPNDMEILTVTYEDKERVLNFLKKRIDLGQYVSNAPKLFTDTVLSSLFPHRIIPHYVWIKDNRVIAITEEVNLEQVEIALRGQYPTLPKKVDCTLALYDRSKTSLLDFLSGEQGNSLSSGMSGYSFFTRFKPALGHNGGYQSVVDPFGYRRITVTNMNLMSLYRLAFGKMKTYINDGAVEINSKDTLLIRTDVSGSKARPIIENRSFCYEIRYREDLSMDLFDKMQQDLRFEFPQFIPSIETRLDTCLVLECTDRNLAELLEPTDFSMPSYNIEDNCVRIRNGTMGGFRTTLEAVFYRYKPVAVVDHTGITHDIDIDLCGDLYSEEGLNKALAKYGLRVSRKLIDHDCLVIIDR